MAAKTSFYFAIFKKIQLIAGVSLSGYPHCRLMPENLGFNLTSPDGNGFFHALDPVEIAAEFGPLLPLVSDATPANPVYPVLPPGAPNSNVPEANPLYAMLKASIKPNGGMVESYWDELTVPVQGSAKLWPVMPQCYDANDPTEFVKMWLEFNKPPAVTLLTALHDWIVDGKPNDSPFQALGFGKPSHVSNANPVLFVCSRTDDNGVRPTMGLEHYWSTSRIFLVNASGPSIGKKAYPAKLAPGAVYNLVAQIGNSGTMAGRCPGYLSNVKVRVYADAFAFNTTMSTSGVPLPALSNLDPASSTAEYEHHYAPTDAYDLAGFRFDVDKVFSGLVAGVDAAVANGDLDLGGEASATDWVQHSHPCVKVRIGIGGDAKNKLPPTDALPTDNPRIAQSNLVMFEESFAAQPPQPPAPWYNFIAEQPLAFFTNKKGPSVIRLTLENALPPDAFTLLVAIPTRTFRRYFAGGKGIAGLEPVPERELGKLLRGATLKPFPNAEILRATGSPASLELTVQARLRALGFSLGIVYDPKKRGVRALGSVSVVHEALRPRARKATVVGGFTVRFVAKEAFR